MHADLLVDFVGAGGKLRGMPSLRFTPLTPRGRFVVITALAIGTAVACERQPSRDRRDSATTESSASTTKRPVPDTSGWDPALGPALLVPGASRDEAVILLPYPGDTAAMASLDSASAAGATAFLLGRGGARLSARLGGDGDESEVACELWPLKDVRAVGDATAWAVGFMSSRVSPMPLDSVEVLTARDSSTLVAEASRLASSVTAETGPSFQGLRFTVHDIRRFSPAPGIQALVAHVMRRVNQEANPQEEQTLLIAERDSGSLAAPYQLLYAERVFGREEDVATPEVVAGLHVAPHATPTLVVARDGDAGVIYALISRDDARHWRVRWTSSRMRCS